MGFDDREIVALSGAHGLGHCHTDRSGFWGPWTFAPTTFSNEYYRLLVEEKWSKKFKHKVPPPSPSPPSLSLSVYRPRVCARNPPPQH